MDRVIRLLPFLLSDGGVYKQREVYFTSTDLALTHYFRQILYTTTGRWGTLIRRGNGCYVVRMRSRELVQRLQNYSPSFSTRIEDRIAPIIPRAVFKNRGLAIFFLRVFASCDGGVSVSLGKNKQGSAFLVRKIFVVSGNSCLREQLIHLFQVLNFYPKAYGKQLRLTTKEDIINFDKHVRFIRGVKITRNSPYFYGMEKNALLDLIIESYSNPKILISLLSNIQLKGD